MPRFRSRSLRALGAVLSVAVFALTACDARARHVTTPPVEIDVPSLPQTASGCVAAFFDALDRGDRAALNRLTYYASRGDLDAVEHVGVGYYRIDHVVLARRVFTVGALVDKRTDRVVPFELPLQPLPVIGTKVTTEYLFTDVAAIADVVGGAPRGEGARVAKRFDQSQLPWARE